MAPAFSGATSVHRKFVTSVAVAGELGLSGEIRRIPNLPKREAEAKKLGFKGLLAPKPDSKSNFIQEAKSLREVLNTWFTVK